MIEKGVSSESGGSARPKSIITGTFARRPASTVRSVGVQSRPSKWASLNPTTTSECLRAASAVRCASVSDRFCSTAPRDVETRCVDPGSCTVGRYSRTDGRDVTVGDRHIHHAADFVFRIDNVSALDIDRITLECVGKFSHAESAESATKIPASDL